MENKTITHNKKTEKEKTIITQPQESFGEWIVRVIWTSKAKHENIVAEQYERARLHSMLVEYSRLSIKQADDLLNKFITINKQENEDYVICKYCKRKIYGKMKFKTGNSCVDCKKQRAREYNKKYNEK